MHAVVTQVRDETHDAKTFRFKPDTPMKFKPGQFVMIELQVPQPDGAVKKVKRAYSLSSSAANSGEVETTVKVYEKGAFSPWLFKLKEGDSVELTGPYGLFVFEEHMSDNIVLIGAGSGVSPLLGMARYLADRKSTVKATFIYSNKTPEDIMCLKDLVELEKKNHNFKCVHTITRPQESKLEWKGRVGRIDSKLVTESAAVNDRTLYYLCGPPEMVKGTREILLNELKVPAQRIKVEIYD
ncbi:MAG TPA: FAD-binding oxidoreductase [archaeon]|nr:FAD-binding oxidoreductase [archaeon]